MCEWQAARHENDFCPIILCSDPFNFEMEDLKMRFLFRHKLASIILIVAPLAVIGLMIACGTNTGSNMQPKPTTGTVTTTLIDQQSCAAPGGPIQKVWVTITKVTANVDITAGPSDSGWVTLLDLTSNPRQIDLFSLASTACVLTTLGSTGGLPAGDYQQIRVYLLSNTAASGPSPNICGSGNGFNCVVPTGGTPQELLLSSEAQTGITIPAGAIAGGRFSVMAGQTVDLQIDFNGCSSILPQGNGQFRLKPTLDAGEIAANSNSISGKVIDSVSNNPIAGAIVSLEQFRVERSIVTARDGTFIFCPLPNTSYNIVVSAQTTAVSLVTTTYNPTTVLLVPSGTNLGNIPLVAETGSPGSTLPATITGQVTSTSSLGATPADVTLSVLLQVTPTDYDPWPVITVPVFGALSPDPNVTTTSTPTPSLPACPVSTDCYNYSLQVPAGNPLVATYSGPNQALSYATQGTGSVNYSLNASSANCTASTPMPANTPLFAVSAGGSTAVSTTLALSGCSPP
jgi:hypothetical protein